MDLTALEKLFRQAGQVHRERLSLKTTSATSSMSSTKSAPTGEQHKKKLVSSKAPNPDSSTRSKSSTPPQEAERSKEIDSFIISQELLKLGKSVDLLQKKLAALEKDSESNSTPVPGPTPSVPATSSTKTVA
jgi:hypothetical protein